VERKGKQLRATEKGQALIGLVAEPLKSPELTADWEQRLKDVEQGEAAVDAFYRDIVAFVRDLLPAVAQGPALSPEQVAAAREGSPKGKGRPGKAPAVRPAGLGTCPVCGQGEVTETAKAFGCSRYRDGCGLTIWKTVAGRKLGKDQVRELLETGRTGRIEGFKSKAGRTFAAALRLSKAGKVKFDFDSPPPVSRVDSPPSSWVGRGGTEGERRLEPRPDLPPEAAGQRPVPSSPLTCPKCGQGHIIEGRRGFGCDRYREGCDFVIWKQVAGRQLTEADVRLLVTQRRTGLIQGFTDPSGNRLDARLRLDASWKVVFEFEDEAG
jgi:DNA topoisomerase-3